jgi:exopolyphosphatase/guanosine-5'-triphosphate,3'-diphosphate pyrophosphatase
MKLAVIDLGSNSLRMGIYEKKDGKITEIRRERHQVRLAEGLGADNMLQKEPMERTIKVFEKYRSILIEENINDFKAIATESLRRAKNASEFIKCVNIFTGISIDVLDGEEEAKYGAEAAKTSMNTDNFYVIDIGGGSVEISKVLKGEVVNFISMPLGCVVMTEKFHPDKNSDREIKEFMKNKFEELSWLNETLPVCVLGGVVKELAGSILGHYNFDGKQVTSDQVLEMYELIYNTPVSERNAKFGIDTKRCDVMTAGLCPLTTLLEKTGKGQIVFCAKGVREGIAMELLNE